MRKTRQAESLRHKDISIVIISNLMKQTFGLPFCVSIYPGRCPGLVCVEPVGLFFLGDTSRRTQPFFHPACCSRALIQSRKAPRALESATRTAVEVIPAASAVSFELCRRE